MIDDYWFVDMHIHILPGVDDGAQNMEMSMEMIRVAAENNIGVMVLTPHNNAAHRCVSPEGQLRRMDLLQNEIYDAGYDIGLYPGNELMYDYSLPQRLNEGRAMTLAGSDYCLVEFYPTEQLSYIREGLRSLQAEGYLPVLAHCERYVNLVKDREALEELVRSGIYLQVNANSILPHGMFDATAKFVNRLLEDELVSFVCTDAHRPTGRAPLMMEAAERVRKRFGGEYTRRIFRDNALTVIENGEI